MSKFQITATNGNLSKLIEQSLFRKDLYYRLNVISIEIPALRKRLDDIECLNENILNKKQSKYNAKNKSISTKAIEFLKCYSWPGNVRKLRNVIEMALILCEDTTIESRHLPENIQRLCVDKGGGGHKYNDYFNE